MTVFNRERHSGSSAPPGAYIIENSCRFNDDDSATTAHTYNAVGSSNKIATLSWWMKLGNLGITRKIFDFDSGQEQIDLHTNDKMRITYASVEALITTQVFRDPTAWYHCVFRIDTTAVAGGDRLRLYVNGTEVTAFDTDTNPSINTIMGGMGINGEVATVGSTQSVSSEFDGYLAEVAMCDGQSLGPGSFGETDDYGNWVPINLSGLTFGNNGFWLDFAVAPGTGNGAGTDVSGNANHFTDAGLAADDKMLDSPSDDADNDIGNYCTLSPVDNRQTAGAISNGNLRAAGLSAYMTTAGTISVNSGKWHIEFLIGTVNGNASVGLILQPKVAAYPYQANETDDAWSIKFDGSNTISKRTSDDVTDSGVGVSVDDIITIEWDSANGDYFVWVNDDAVNSGATMFTGGNRTALAGATVTPFIGQHTSGSYAELNCGQRPFTRTPSTDYKALATFNLDAPAIKDPSKYFQIDTFTGTGAELVRTLTDAAGDAFKPELIWIKDRDTATDHVMSDIVRGATKEINPNVDGAETTVAQGIKSFNASGYTLGTDTDYNQSSSLNVAWLWALGGTAVTNEVGSIDTSLSANTTSKAFALTWTGNGTAGATLGHGMGAAPVWLHGKNLVDAGHQFSTGHSGMTSWEYHLRLDSSTAEATNNQWDNAGGTGTAPSSTVVTVGASSVENSSSGMMMFGFAEVEGYSKFGRYKGNSSTDGPFVWCGFRPAWLWINRATTAGAEELIVDSSRSPYNPMLLAVASDVTHTETYMGAYSPFDFLANGFKIRGATAAQNYSISTFVWAAFAEFPFGGEDVSQARAR